MEPAAGTAPGGGSNREERLPTALWIALLGVNGVLTASILCKLKIPFDSYRWFYLLIWFLVAL